ncbi:DMT family transporter [Pseudoalteromonas xiamenensis]|uniref:DMT family transporter n=1 Tax=Pseudoalteromonas xiamenensis TaxID=882626 RepID=UPI0027E4E8C2|nr:DMT family transporter [Pseudoalteromonas xiamenensis]WMN60506.1 DMT family transporter [Pseudoalteromonas xiamenensis]
MSVRISYLFVILVWSTTPLGIVWSSETISPTLSVFLRMVIALVLAAFFVAFANIRVPWTRLSCLQYLYSAFGIVGGMLLSYLAAQTVPSGVISLVFGLAPFFSGILGYKLLGEAKFTPVKLVALGLALVGLYLICVAQLQELEIAPAGLIYVFLAVCSFSLSGVLIKKVPVIVHPMATTFGALVFVTPILATVWWFTDGHFEPQLWETRSIWATVYLGVFGSLLGFLAYFHVLQKLPAGTVALTTLITPGFAISLGAWLNNEQLTATLLVGAVIVLSSLGLFQFGDKWLGKKSLFKQKEMLK